MTEAKDCTRCADEEACSAKAQGTDETNEAYAERQQLMRRMCRIKHKIVVLSGKGGVGKSTVAVNLAISLASAGKQVGLLDVDIHGPSIPRLLNLEGQQATGKGGDTLLPMIYDDNLKVMSIGFLLRERDAAVIWRGPMKYGVIKQFLKDVEWGDLDYLVVDSPPGTGDEPLSVCQLIEGLEGAIIVTTPQELALLDVRKSISFCQTLKVPVLGVIENMSGFVCPNCGEVTDIFKRGGAERMAAEMGVPFLGRVPLDPALVVAGDKGMPFAVANSQTETAKTFGQVIQPILQRNIGKTETNVLNAATNTGGTRQKEDGNMRIAIPIAGGRLSAHFGHCEEFALIDVDTDTKTITAQESSPAPDHQPGLLPKWLSEHGANVIIAGGMGSRAKDLFAAQNIEVIVGAPVDDAETIAKAYLDGTLSVGSNICDH